MKRVVFLHPHIHNLSEMCRYLCIEKIKEQVQIVWDESNPEIVIASEYIYKKKEIFKKFAKYYKSDEIKNELIYIYNGGEIADPDLNIFDYGITYNDKLSERDRIYRIPIVYKRFACQDFINDLSYEEALSIVSQKKFCNFIYSNPFAPEIRDRLFFEISRYRQVDSLGAHLNNSGLESTRDKKNWMDISVQQKSKYKFTIACENAQFPGGTSEKLLTSLKAHTVPIYWGNPYVDDEFNSECYINCHKYNTMEEIVDAISMIDRNDNLWAKMVSAPWQTSKQVCKTQEYYNKYFDFFVRLFSMPNEEMMRRPTGSFINLYKEKFFRPFGFWNSRDYFFLLSKRLR